VAGHSRLIMACELLAHAGPAQSAPGSHRRARRECRGEV